VVLGVLCDFASKSFPFFTVPADTLPQFSLGAPRLVARYGDAILRNATPDQPGKNPMRLALALAFAAAIAGCASKPTKEDEDAAKNTFACQLQGERLVLRFDAGEARMLMPGGERVVLYQIPGGSGVRFSNGNLELRGKGVDLTLVDNATATQMPLVGCAPYAVPKQ
jgi:membrane-bound inhibitor of C-type lysozyme